MPLDILTLLVLTSTNLFTLAAALPLLMGRRISASARYAQGSILAQAIGWAAVIAAGRWYDPQLSTLAMGSIALSQWLLFRALRGWLGPRSGEGLLIALVVITPLGYALAFHDYQWRVGWANFLLALSMLVVARATLWPQRPAGRGWRWLLCGCLLTMASFTTARGVLGVFFTELYPYFRAPHPVNILAAVAGNMTLVLGLVAVLVAWREEAEAELQALAMSDPLTGLLNRRGFHNHAQALLSDARRRSEPLTLLALDIDHFKQINDTHGHEAGDRALTLISRVLRTNQRGVDLVARLGGEEFCVLFARSSREAGLAFDARLRTRLREASLQELGFGLDFSAGLAVHAGAGENLEGLLARADAALYEAKRAGRGRLVQAGD